MDCSRATTTFLERCPSLSKGVVGALKIGSNQRYLNTLSELALEPEYTSQVYCCFEEIFPELCMRWKDFAEPMTQVEALARILIVAPHLTEFLVSILSQESVASKLSSILNANSLNVSNQVHRDSLESALLCIFRLLLAEHDTFSRCLQVDKIPSLLSSQDERIRHIAIRITAQVARSSDNTRQAMFGKYCDFESLIGAQNGPVNHEFLLLYEQQRMQVLKKQLQQMRSDRTSGSNGPYVSRTLVEQDLSRGVVNIGGRLFLQSSPKSLAGATHSSLVLTDTICANVRALVEAIVIAQVVLITGQAGSGKSTIIEHVAARLGKASEMITLHLNEQSDAKLLLGIYTIGDQPGSFKWQPGVLTTAVREGHWVLIENLDRVPNDVLGLLLPLIERSELRIPGNDETIKARSGFKLLATTRSHINLQGQETVTQMRTAGIRSWHHIRFNVLPADELKIVIADKFPQLKDLSHRMLLAWRTLQLHCSRQGYSGRSKSNRSRPLSIRDLLKWCSRVRTALLAEESSLSNATISERLIDSMLLDAVDCFLGHLPQADDSRIALTSCIAEELQIGPSRKSFLCEARKPDLVNKSDARSVSTIVGRTALEIQAGRRTMINLPISQPYSLNRQTCKLMEQIAVAVRNREPLLLVGETGIGKTTALQYLAQNLGREMLVINLSQQSEAGDLLGGYKPVSIQSLVMPLKDEFDELFAQTFSRSRNNDYARLLADVIAKRQWYKTLKLWKQALATIEKHILTITPESLMSTQRRKRRKVNDRSGAVAQAKWEQFAAKIEALENQLKKSSASFAFSFVEGTLVRAVRNGTWLLLDEINLASPDTLESLSDLLESGAEKTPFILLTETGSTERIKAHPDFRMFAAMNPSTDVGKKDLPLGVRSRLTELYVDSPDSDRQSLESIVESYLCQSTTSQPQRKICSVVADLYMNILGLVERGKLVDGFGERARYSLRSLTRALSHAVTIAPRRSLKRGVYEGMAMCFSTSLDTNSEAMLQQQLKTALFQDEVQGNAELRHPLQPPTGSQAHTVIKFVVEMVGNEKRGREESHWLPKGLQSVQNSPDYIITPFIARNLRNLIRAASTCRYPVLIQGPTSAGKTSMVEYLARRCGNKFTRINNHEHTDLQEYLGTYVSDSSGKIVFQEGVLVQALRRGDWVVLDELNLAPTDVLEALNRLLDENRELLIPETQEIVKPHPNFMLFATQNPAGTYGGRKPLSRAFQNRFLELHFEDIPVSELQIILAKRSQLPESWCSLIIKVHARLSQLRSKARLFERNSYATLRDLFRWAFRGGDTVQALAEHGFMLLAEKVRKPEEKQLVKQAIEQVMSGKGTLIHLNKDHLYPRPKGQHLISGNQIVWTKAMSRLFNLVKAAVIHNEPVLLVGETGGGKTTVIQLIAALMSKTLHVVNAYENMETSDLIGAQRPVRDRSVIEEELFRDLAASMSHLSIAAEAASDTNTLLSIYDSLDQNILQQLPESLCKRISSNRSRIKALFEWQDGSLVQAMGAGDFFLLDEISLAEDSVLERMNSVLDPQRSILLAEKGTTDSLVAAQPGFQLFATMNPGGDFGKKELSAALRNRFTEIWVAPMDDYEDLLNIVKANVNAHAQAYAPSIVEFATWFNKCYGPSRRSSVSIRDLLAWVNFVSVCRLPLVESVIQGAMTVFIDTLGANPSALPSLSNVIVGEARKSCVEMLSQLLKTDVGLYLNPDLEFRVDDTTLAIGAFSFPTCKATALDARYTFDSVTTRRNAMRILRAMQLSKPVLLEGAPGVGKTSLVTALATCTGNVLTRINLSEQTDLMDLFGSDVPAEGKAPGTFVWRDAPFLTAMKEGGWVLLDEMNLSSQSVLEGLNACIDHRGEVFISELGKTFKKHPTFRLFAAQNPHHQGGGRKGLPMSFVNRFTLVFADLFQAEDLITICHRAFPTVQSPMIGKLVQFVAELNRKLDEDRAFGSRGSPWEFNLRDTLRCLQLLTSGNGLIAAGEPHDYLDIVFTQRLRSHADREVVHSIIVSRFGPRANPRSYFTNISLEAVQVGLGLLSRRVDRGGSAEQFVDLSPCRLPLLESLIVSVNEQWPVLLVGAPEADKAGILRTLSALAGVDLEYIAISADLDANDLIGSYEQVDPLRQVQAFLLRLRQFIHQCPSRLAIIPVQEHVPPLMSQLLGLLRMTDITHPANEKLERIDTCLAAIEDILMSLPSLEEAVEILFELRKHRKECRRLQSVGLEPRPVTFEWVDGMLVRAIERGAWLVLENANLCSGSVLDRLNSLLETDRCLIINEHSSPDGTAKTIRPHSNFRIFLTIDPQFGEISRAMRNRVVELFVPNSVGESQNIMVPLESWSSSFAQLVHLCQSIEDDESFERGCTYAIQRLGLQDLKILQHFVLQADTFLSSSQVASLRAIAARYSTISASNEPYLGSNWALENKPWHRLGKRGLESLQTIHPLSNGPLLLSGSGTSESLKLLGLFHDCQYQVQEIDDMLSRLQSPSHQLVPSQGTSSTSSSKAMEILAGNPLEFSDCLHAFGALDGPRASQVLKMMLEVLQIWRLLIRMRNMRHYESGRLTPFINVIQGIIERIGRDAKELMPLCRKLSRILSLLATAGALSTGLSMERIWKRYRSKSPATTIELNNLLALEQVADRSDEVTWTAAVPLYLSTLTRRDLVKAMIATRIYAGDSAQSSARLQGFVNSLPTQTPRSRIVIQPHFLELFASICAFTSLGCPADAEHMSMQHNLEQIRLLAQIPSKTEARNFQTNPLQDSLSAFSACFQLTSDAKSAFIDFSAVLKVGFSTINAVQKVPLLHFALLQDEVPVLGRFLATSGAVLHNRQQETIRKHTRVILEHIVCAHSNKLIHTSGIGDESLRLRSDVPTDDYFRTIVDEYLLRASDAVAHHSETAETWHELGIALVYLALGCLQLYVPDQPFDPADSSSIERTVHLERLQDLGDQIATSSRVEKLMTGQAQNLRTILLAEDIQKIGPTPEAHVVLRPEVSQVTELQAEFTNVLRLVKRTAQAINQNQLKDFAQSGIFYQISNVARTLSTDYRPYDDITRTVVGFLGCLFLGLQINSHLSQPQHPALQSPVIAPGKIPFVNTDLTQWLQGPQHLGDQLRPWSVAELQRVIRTFALRAQLEEPAHWPNTTRQTLLGALDAMCQHWKSDLTLERKQGEKAANLYHYRGGDDGKHEIDEHDFLELFPSYEEDETSSHGEGDFQADSSSMAKLHQDIFLERSDGETRMLDLLHYASLALGQDVSTHTYTAQTLAPMLLQLRQQRQIICHPSKPGEDYNIYTDANVPQALRLRDLLTAIRSRTEQIVEVWPEHATLRNIVAACEEQLMLPYSQPLAKHFGKIERLHAYVDEWQKMASKEYSLDEFPSAIAELLISWRLIELSSWSRLLDLESKKCEEEAQSWWFVAYENIISLPESYDGSDEEVQARVVEIVGTVESLLRSSSIGQFHARLKIIASLQAQLNALFPDRKMSVSLRRALGGLLAHYKRFYAAIQNNVDQGRMTLEKEVKNVMLMTHIKRDTNITALKQSAKASHRKLFAVVRKFRELLRRPVEPLLNASISAIVNPSLQELIKPRTIVDSTALQICESRGIDWQSRPPRFRRVTDVVDTMADMCMAGEKRTLEATVQVQDFTSTLEATVNHLREATPAMLTEENSAAVKHLATRKRKLFAETLKDLRRMGVRQAQTVNTLASQSSLARVLVDNPLQATCVNSTVAEAGAACLHSSLDNMAQVRSASGERHQDLTTSDASRSIGTIEGLVALALRQRKILAESDEGHASLVNLVSKARNVWQDSRSNVSPCSHDTARDLKTFTTIVRWLPSIIKAGVQLLEAQAYCGNCDYSQAVDSLVQHASRFDTLREQLLDLPVVASGLISRSASLLVQEVGDVIKAFEIDLHNWTKAEPATQLVMAQLLHWTSYDNSHGETNGVNGGRSVDLASFNVILYTTLDKILGSMQDVRTAMELYPSTTEDADWLARSSSVEQSVLARFQLLANSSSLDALLAMLQHFDVNDDAALTAACASLTLVVPILEQYTYLHQRCLARFWRLHEVSSRMLLSLTTIFGSLASQGFCKPMEKSEESARGKEKLEAGTGLGEGEGSEDISNDIEADEDMSELAQDPNNAGLSNDQEQDEASNDAVEIEDDLTGGRGGAGEEEAEEVDGDVDQDETELERELADGSQGEDGMDDQNGDANAAKEETVGDVDDLQPSAIDEKLWDKAGEPDQKQKEGGQKATAKDNDDQAAGKDRQGDSDDQEATGPKASEDEDSVNNDDNGADEVENEDAKREQQAEAMDPNVHESEGLDLPEELNLDAEKGGRDKDDDSDIDMLSEEGAANDDAEEMQPQEDSDMTVDESAKAAEGVDRVAEDERDLQDIIDEDGVDENENGNESISQPMQDKHDALAKPYVDQQMGDEQAEPTGTARGTDGTQTIAGHDQAQDVEDQDQDRDQDQGDATLDATAADDAQTNDQVEPLGRSRADQSSSAQHQQDSHESEEMKFMKQAGDLRQQFHRQHRGIREQASARDQGQSHQRDLDIAGADFEHLRDEDAEADAQALGAALQDQARPIDENMALPGQDESAEQERERDNFESDVVDDAEHKDDSNIDMQDPSLIEQAQAENDLTARTARIGEPTIINSSIERPQDVDSDMEMQDSDPNDLEEVSSDLQTMALQPSSPASPADLWAHYEGATQSLAHLLTEQLRLILAPTLATKLCGGYRTGKRINMKAIIPYIASSFRRDKIWLRRSQASKRTYQIQLALDDSRSMADNGSAGLAFSTLALVARALTMLESGEVGVLGFGKGVFVAHELGLPFTSESGAEVVTKFGFEQTTTDVYSLVRHSIDIFKDARLRSQSASDLWQLQLIISDGICESHANIRRLLLEAQEERIIFVFVIVDAANNKEVEKGKGKAPNKSINDLITADFTEGTGLDGEAETKLVRRRYMESFPFRFYLIVEDVQDLPIVLTEALRGWFAEVANI